MTWFFAILIVLVMGVVAVVAAGRGGTMAEVYDDRPDSRVPAEGRLTALDVRRVRFSTALRGYRMSEVDSLLDRLAAQLETAAVAQQPVALAEQPVALAEEPVARNEEPAAPFDEGQQPHDTGREE